MNTLTKIVNTRTPYSQLEKILNEFGYSINVKPFTQTNIVLYHNSHGNNWVEVNSFRGKHKLIEFINALEKRVYRYLIDDNIHISICTPTDFEELEFFVNSTYQTEKECIKFELLNNMPLTSDIEKCLTNLVNLTNIKEVIGMYEDIKLTLLEMENE